jgi:hypothetical protein
MNSTILIEIIFILLFAHTCTCLSFCNNGTANVDTNDTVIPNDKIANISCTTQFCVVNGIKRHFLFLLSD